MKEICWGIIGCGDVTEVKSGPAFNKVPGSKLVAVMRRDAKKAKDYAARHHVPKWYSDAHQLINDPEVNAVYVATPPLQHEEYAIASLRAGKPVYVEKPMAIHKEAAERIWRTAEETGVKVSVAHYRRQLPLFKKVKELLQTNAVGTIRLVNLQLLQPSQSKIITQAPDNWRVNPVVSGGGLFHDLAPHQLDLMIYFFGGVKKLNGISINQAEYYEADDVVSTQMLLNPKVLFHGVWCFTVPKEEARDCCEIIGSDGKISFSIFEQRNLTVTKGGGTKEFDFDKLPHVQQPMIEKVVDYFLDKGTNPCTAEEGVAVMRLIDELTGK